MVCVYVFSWDYYNPDEGKLHGFTGESAAVRYESGVGNGLLSISLKVSVLHFRGDYTTIFIPEFYRKLVGSIYIRWRECGLHS